jgi:hypothetical protein
MWNLSLILSQDKEREPERSRVRVAFGCSTYKIILALRLAGCGKSGVLG